MQIISLREAIQNRGLRPTVGLSIDTPFLAAIDNLKASPLALIPFDPLVDPYGITADLTNWPFPQILITKRHAYCFAAVTGHMYFYDVVSNIFTQVIMKDINTAGNVNYLPTGGNLYHIVDFGEYIILTNGTNTLVRRATTGVWQVSQGATSATYPHVNINTVAEFKGLSVAGGLTLSTPWKAIFTALMQRHSRAYAVQSAGAFDMLTSESVFWAGPTASLLDLIAPQDNDGTILDSDYDFTSTAAWTFDVMDTYHTKVADAGNAGHYVIHDNGSIVVVPITQTIAISVGRLYRVLYEVATSAGASFYVDLGGTKTVEREPGGYVGAGSASNTYTVYTDYIVAGASTTLSLCTCGLMDLRRVIVEEADTSTLLENLQSGASGWTHLVGSGTVYNLKPLGDFLIAYCSKGVWALHKTYDPELTLTATPIYGIAIMYRDAVAGNSAKHYFIDITGNLCFLTAEMLAAQTGPKIIGFQRLLSSLYGTKPLIGYDEALDELRIGNQVGAGYVYTNSGLTSCGQAGHQICYSSATRIAAAKSGTYTTFTITTDVLALGRGTQKLFDTLEIIGVGLSSCSVVCHYRHTITGAMTDSASIAVQEDGTCHFDVPGTQVSFTITGTIASDGCISDIRLGEKLHERDAI